MHEGMIVSIVGGPFHGHRGMITRLPEDEPTIAIVAVERATLNQWGKYDERTVPSFESYYVARTDLEPYRKG